MRALTTVLRWLSPAVLGLILLGITAFPTYADTGTYRISSYVATIEPQSSGAVRITYEQEWRVLSGNIPWITVGLPNASFKVEGWGGAAARVYANNGGGFTGVRADLDRTYLSGETFRVSFTVLQNSLLERLTAEKKWRIDYTPGWYDLAVIDRLQIKLISPVALDSYSLVNPVPASSSNNTVTWERLNLSPGARLEIKVESLDGGFLSATTPGAKKGTSPWPIVIGIFVAVAVVGFIVVAVIKAKQARDAALKERIAATEREIALDPDKKEAAEKGFREYVIQEDIQPDEQGRYYDRSYGDYITPTIWAAVILGQQRNAANTTTVNRSSGYSCACACVSCACACACACAGGGAAGCSRKTLHECRERSQCAASEKSP